MIAILISYVDDFTEIEVAIIVGVSGRVRVHISDANLLGDDRCDVLWVGIQAIDHLQSVHKTASFLLFSEVRILLIRYL